MSKVIVIGGGASGILAAISARTKGHEVTLLEKNNKLGKKIYITGKGRCNLTSSSDKEETMKNIVSNPRFLYSAFSVFFNKDIIKMVEEEGCLTKEERGNRIFPVSDKANDVTIALEKRLKRLGVKILLDTKAKKIIVDDNKVTGVKLDNNNILSCDDVIIATGGISYSSTGSTGDGHAFAKSLGHTVTELSPALVAMETKERWVNNLTDLDLKNVAIKIKRENKVLYEDFGEMGFCHNGVDGPVIISASSIIGRKLPLDLYVDLKPALQEDVLDKRILRDFDENKNKTIDKVIGKLLPIKLGLVVLQLSNIPKEQVINTITSAQRKTLRDNIKSLKLTLIACKSFEEAIITQGGISIKEINPSTMESKLIEGLYFVGEVLDVDALTGGYNLQIAWSTGYLAGNSIK